MWKKYLGVCVVLALVALALAPTEAVSQMCEATDGSPRECTISEAFDICLFAAIDAAEQRVAAGTDSGTIRWIQFSADVAACGFAYVTPLV
jgi:hypothetical protein